MSHGIEALLFVVSLAAAPCGESPAEATASEASKPGKPLTLDDVERIALARVPGGKVEDIERDHRLGKLVYEVEVRARDGREHDLVIDEDGRVIAEEIDD